ncbi:MAG: hypothetical protein PHV57_11565, partial [Methanomicrobiaceae archaeon]|nr:hypothetical protein [Methanomicrobiaceae archaeon]
MIYLLSIFSQHEHRKLQKVYRELVRKLLGLLERWEEFSGIRSLIEDVFKLVKDTFSLRAVHRYLRLSVIKFVALHVLLVGGVILAGINRKKTDSERGGMVRCGGGYKSLVQPRVKRMGSSLMQFAFALDRRREITLVPQRTTQVNERWPILSPRYRTSWRRVAERM